MTVKHEWETPLACFQLRTNKTLMRKYSTTIVTYTSNGKGIFTPQLPSSHGENQQADFDINLGASS